MIFRIMQKDAVIWAAEKSVMTGNTDGSFAPKANTTKSTGCFGIYGVWLKT